VDAGFADHDIVATATSTAVDGVIIKAVAAS
jgi:hypothetical protein